MARDGNGTYSLPEAPFVFDTVIDEAAVNNNFSDIASALSQSLSKDGQTVPTGNLPMGGQRHTGVGNASARNDYSAVGQVQDGAFTWCGTAAGSANALTLNPSPAITAYAAGQLFGFIAGAAANTGATTVVISGLTAADIQLDGAALVGGEIQAGRIYHILYDGTQFQLAQSFSPPPQSDGLRRITTFEANGSYNKPSWLRVARVRVWGGGGGGAVGFAPSGTCGSGGGGGYTEKLLLDSEIAASETVTIGAGGAGGSGAAPSQGTTGGTTSFGAHCSATGGGGGAGAAAAGAAGGASGSGIGGDDNRTGGRGSNGSEIRVVIGGDAPFGRQGGRGIGTSGSGGGSQAGRAPGGGGSSGITETGLGGDGAAGLVIIYEYE